MSSENNFAGSFFLIIIIKANVNTQPFADSSCLSWKNEGEHLKQRHQLTESINHSFFQNEYNLHFYYFFVYYCQTLFVIETLWYFFFCWAARKNNSNDCRVSVSSLNCLFVLAFVVFSSLLHVHIDDWALDLISQLEVGESAVVNKHWQKIIQWNNLGWEIRKKSVSFSRSTCRIKVKKIRRRKIYLDGRKSFMDCVCKAILKNSTYYVCICAKSKSFAQKVFIFLYYFYIYLDPFSIDINCSLNAHKESLILPRNYSHHHGLETSSVGCLYEEKILHGGT